MAIKEITSKNPVRKATRIKQFLSSAPKSRVYQKAKPRTLPQIAKPKPVETATPLEDVVKAVTQSLTVLAKGVENLSEQNKIAILKSIAQTETSNQQLQQIVAQLSRPEKPRITNFTVTHRDDEGRIVGFTAEENETVDVPPSYEVAEGQENYQEQEEQQEEYEDDVQDDSFNN